MFTTRTTRISRRTVAGTIAGVLVFSLACRSAAPLAAHPDDSAGPVLLPGDSELSTAHLQPSTIVFRVLWRAPHPDSLAREIARGRNEVHQIDVAGSPALLLVTASEKAGQFVDTAVVRPGSLAPMWETMHAGPATTRFDYDGPSVRVARTTPDSGTRTVTHRYDMPVFHFNELDVVIRSLPLRPGYHAILPLYSEGTDVLEMDTVRVVARGADDVWSIRFADPAIVVTYGVSGRTRDIVRYDVVSRRNGFIGQREVIGTEAP
jgi:YD repeat-containing protein